MGGLREGVWFWFWFWWAAAAMAAADWAVRRGHAWWWTKGMDAERKGRLPAGDMGWPLVGGMWAFLRAFKSGDPDAFINSFHHREAGGGGPKDGMDRCLGPFAQAAVGWMIALLLSAHNTLAGC